MVKVFSQLFQVFKYSLCCKWVVCYYYFWNSWLQSFVNTFVLWSWHILARLPQHEICRQYSSRLKTMGETANANLTIISCGNKIQKPSSSDSDVSPLTNILVTGVSEDQSWIINFLYLWWLTCHVEWCRQRNHKRPTEVITAWLPVLLNLSPLRPDWGERSSLTRLHFTALQPCLNPSGGGLPMVQACFSL